MVEFARALLRNSRSEGGFTFPELTVGFAVSLIIGVAAMSFILISARQWQGQEDRVSTTDDARNALHAMVGELRDASLVRVVDTRTVDATVRIANGAYQQVRFQCVSTPAPGSCSRTVVATGAGKQLVTGLVNIDNFAVVQGAGVSGSPSLGGSLAIKLALDLDKAQNPIVLSSVVKPRNCAAAAAGVINPPC